MSEYVLVQQYFIVATSKVVDYEGLKDYYLLSGLYEDDCEFSEDCRCTGEFASQDFSEIYHFAKWLDSGSPSYFIDVSYTMPEIWARDENKPLTDDTRAATYTAEGLKEAAEKVFAEVENYTYVTTVTGKIIKVPVFMKKMEEEKEDF